MSDERKFNVVLAGLILTIIVIFFFARNRGDNPVTITNNRLRDLETTVLDWAAKNGNPPASLDELGLRKEAIVDHKGTPFVYETNGSKVTISSLGADDKPGGFMFKADRSVTFDTATAKK